MNSPQKLPIEENLKILAEAGNSVNQLSNIGKEIASIHPRKIARTLKRLNPRQSTEIYKEHKADILAERQRQILMQMVEKDRENARNTKDWTIALSNLHNMEQAVRGLSPDARPMVVINNLFTEAKDVSPPIDVTPVPILEEGQSTPNTDNI